MELYIYFEIGAHLFELSISKKIFLKLFEVLLDRSIGECAYLLYSKFFYDKSELIGINNI